VLADEQTGRLVIELLADFLAELRADFAAARTNALGFGQRIFLALPRQIGRQFLAAVARAFRLGRLRIAIVVGRRGRWRHLPVGVDRQFRNQPGLIWIEAFRFRTVQPT
jgi:hypothetical protein